MTAPITVLVTGPAGAGVTSVAAALGRALPDCTVTENAAGPARVVVFAVSAAAPLTHSQAAMLTAAAPGAAAVAAVTKIDVHRDWRQVLAENERLLRGFCPDRDPTPWTGVAADPDIGAPVVAALAAEVRRAMHRPAGRGTGRTAAAARRSRLLQTRLHLLGRVREDAAALQADLHRTVRTLRLGRLAAFSEELPRRVAAAAGEWDRAASAELGALTGEFGLTPAVPSEAPPTVPEVPRVPPDPQERRLAGLLGGVFGLGAALTLARLLAEMTPRAGGAWQTVAAAAAGLCLAAWVVRTRRLLAERSVAERRVSDLVAAARAVTDHRVASRVLAVEAAVAESAAGPGRSGDTAVRRTGRWDTAQPALTFRGEHT